MCLLRDGGHGDVNKGEKGGLCATASMMGGSKYQVVIILDCLAVGTCLRRVRRITS
jgi:hypothetical protein